MPLSCFVSFFSISFMKESSSFDVLAGLISGIITRYRRKNMKKIDVYGTVGPACNDKKILSDMFKEGMTGIRLNMSHVGLSESKEVVGNIFDAAKETGVESKLLIDLQGPELRIGKIDCGLELKEGDEVGLVISESEKTKTVTTENRGFKSEHGEAIILIPKALRGHIAVNQEVLLDDGKILLKVINNSADGLSALAKVVRGGNLTSRKSIALPDLSIDVPALTEQDKINISLAKEYGVTGIMQPFVRGKEDLIEVREYMNSVGAENIKLFAKIENMTGVERLDELLDYADEIIIARGDLGNAMPLWKLPRVQKDIARKCNETKVPFMVVTQMLSSMEHSKVPTRAEISDIYNAVLDGANSVMVTGETAVGEYPAEVIKYLSRTVKEALLTLAMKCMGTPYV